MVMLTTPGGRSRSMSESHGERSHHSDNDTSVLDKDSNIRVIVRCRPPNERERASDGVIRVMGPYCLVFDPKEEDMDEFGNRSGPRQRQYLGRKPRDLRFAFDRVLDEQATNQQAYEHSAKFVVDGVLSGYNCSVFAYGATGAGKTHTMLGTECEPGVMYRTMLDLYAYMSKVEEECHVDVSVSYLEVYNEDVRDLLMPKRCSLPVREDPKQGVLVHGLSVHKPSTMEELLVMLDFGNTNRSQHPTDANAESSRSHAVFQVFVRQKPRDSGLHAKVRHAKMSLIDLAGSERATVTKNMGKRFREGANINRSLLALGNVINALASGKTKSKHVPYRDSKLTRILKDSLGGNCRTVMIAAVSPSTLSYEDTYNTLRYAERTKAIKAQVKENIVSVDLHIHNYAKIVEELKSENRDLREKLAVRPPCAEPALPKYAVDPDILGLKVHIDNVYSERLTFHRELLELECQDRELQIKLASKRHAASRHALVALASSDTELVRQRSAASCRSLESRRSALSSRRHKAQHRLAENANKLEQVHAECTAVTDDNSMPEVLSLTDDLRRAEIQLADQRRQVKFLKKTARQQQREIDVRDRLLTVALTALRHHFTSISESSGLLPDAYQTLLQMVSEQNREVVWADQTLPNNNDEVSTFNLQQVLNFPSVTPGGDSVASSPRRKTPRKKRSQSAKSPKVNRDVNRTVDVSHSENPVLHTTAPGGDDTSPIVTEQAGRTPFPKLCLDSPKENGVSDAAQNTAKNYSSSKCNKENLIDVKSRKICDTTTKSERSDTMNFEPRVTTPSAKLFVNSETVTKGDRSGDTGPVVKSGTMTKTAVNSLTVTKVPSPEEEEGSRRSSAVRAMTFEQTPKAKNATFSYADMVKSPSTPAESPLPACVISPIPLTPSHVKQRTPLPAASVQRTPAGSISRIRTDYCGSPLLSSSPKLPRHAVIRRDEDSPVLSESYTVQPASNTPEINVNPPSATSSTLRRPLADQANVMTSRLPVKSPIDNPRRVQFQDQENRDVRSSKLIFSNENVSKTASEHAQKLEKYGLPALSVPSEKKKKGPPGYMRMTHAAEGRARQNGPGNNNTNSAVPKSGLPTRGRHGQDKESKDFKRSASLNRLDSGQSRTFSRTKSSMQFPSR